MIAGLFALGAFKMHWNSARQAAIAENIANANTPGYRVREAPKFADAYNNALQALQANDASSNAASAFSNIPLKEQRDKPPAVLSGNTVELEDEMKKLAEAHRDYAADAAFMKTFHRMTMSSVRTAG